MAKTSSTFEVVKKALGKKLLFLPHAVNQMAHPERMISPADVESALLKGSIIEDYPNDIRGHSCLILGKDLSGRLIHVVCAPKKDFLAVITAYVPNESEWKDGFKMRRKL